MCIIRGNISNVVMKALPILSLSISFVILYLIYPGTFEPVWTGTWENRVGYILFAWLSLFEAIIAWDDLQIRKWFLVNRKIVFVPLLLSPTFYVFAANFLRFNQAIVDLSQSFGIKPAWATLMPLSIEYLVLGFLFALILLVEYGFNGLRLHSISISFLMVFGVVYMINNLQPFGEFAPFQALAVPTAIFAEKILSLMGYKTALFLANSVPCLYAADPNNPAESFAAQIDWPCAGVESLMIYTVTILLFLKKSSFSIRQSVIYFLVGAAITYFINILRITTLYVIAIHGGGWGIFHDYFGPLYSSLWIVLYPLLIIGSRELWFKLRRGVDRHWV